MLPLAAGISLIDGRKAQPDDAAPGDGAHQPDLIIGVRWLRLGPPYAGGECHIGATIPFARRLMPPDGRRLTGQSCFGSSCDIWRFFGPWPPHGGCWLSFR